MGRTQCLKFGWTEVFYLKVEFFINFILKLKKLTPTGCLGCLSCSHGRSKVVTVSVYEDSGFGERWGSLTPPSRFLLLSVFFRFFLCSRTGFPVCITELRRDLRVFRSFFLCFGFDQVEVFSELCLFVGEGYVRGFSASSASSRGRALSFSFFLSFFLSFFWIRLSRVFSTSSCLFAGEGYEVFRRALSLRGGGLHVSNLGWSHLSTIFFFNSLGSGFSAGSAFLPGRAVPVV